MSFRIAEEELLKKLTVMVSTKEAAIKMDRALKRGGAVALPLNPVFQSEITSYYWYEGLTSVCHGMSYGKEYIKKWERYGRRPAPKVVLGSQIDAWELVWDYERGRVWASLKGEHNAR